MIEIVNKNGIINLNPCKNEEILIENSDVTIYEKNASDYNVTFKIVNSNIKYFSYDLKDNLSIIRDFNVYSNSNLEIVLGHFGNGKVSSIINLLEKFSKASIKTVSISNDKDLNVNLEINHLSPDTEGINENYVIAKNVVIKYDVIGKILNGMKRSKCSQKTRGIVIDKGQVEADPVLLIDEFDVSANHGACIGKISDEGLFYLMSRGISKQDSLMLIVNGFLNPIYNLILDEEYKLDFIKASKLKME